VLAATTTRRLLGLGALLAAGFALYGSLVPLHVRPMAFADAVREFRALERVPFAAESKTDLLSNFALFLPIGFLGTGALVAGRSRLAGFVAIPFVLAFAVALSVGIEFAQIFIPSRTASLNDIANETAGAVAGAIAWLVAGPFVTRWISGFTPATSARSDLARRMLVAYSAIWIVLGLLPLDITIRPPELAEKYRQGRVHVIPLTGGKVTAVQAMLGTGLLAVPVGALAALGWPHARRRASFVEGALAGSAAIAAMEVCQLFVFSRTASVDDVIGGVIGAVAGARIAAWMAGAGETRPGSGIRLWPLAVLVLWVGVILARHWSPFNFVVTGDMFRERAPALLDVPLRSYYWANPFDALSEALTKILLGGPVGVLLTLFLPAPRTLAGRTLAWLAILLTGLAIFSVVEVGQVFLPSRYPDGTDILLGTLGTCCGALGTRLVLSGVQVSGSSAGRP
jgi:VanZ family protein